MKQSKPLDKFTDVLNVAPMDKLRAQQRGATAGVFQPEGSSKLENEYMENLKKQIHFLGLEVSLLKQRDNEREAQPKSINEPATTHLIQTKDKFNTLTSVQATYKAAAEEELLRLNQSVASTLAKANHLRRLVSSLTAELNSAKAEAESKSSELRLKAGSLQKTAEDLERQLVKARAAHEAARDENAHFLKLKTERDFDLSFKNLAEEEERHRHNLKESDLEKRLSQIKNEIVTVQAAADDPSLRGRLVELQAQIKQREIDLGEAIYRTYESEKLLKLACKWSDSESKERIRLREELERINRLYLEGEKGIEARVGRKFREAEKTENRRLEVLLARERKDLEDEQERAEKVESLYRRLKLEVQLKGEELKREKTVLEKINEQRISTKSKQKEDVQPQHQIYIEASRKAEVELERARRRYTDLENEDRELTIRRETLRAEIEFLEKNFDFDAVLKLLDIDALQKLVESNKSVNNTVQNLVSNWHEIKNL